MVIMYSKPTTFLTLTTYTRIIAFMGIGVLPGTKFLFNPAARSGLKRNGE